ncbi:MULTISPECIES: hypothetical protein [Delftia]|uniref:hypothetical protein n=1 Tax=Delftia TaxID=80865 RepID=UPI00257A3420|nr:MULTISPECIES: hypothetical protein [unclassified Delftia]
MSTLAAQFARRHRSPGQNRACLAFPDFDQVEHIVQPQPSQAEVFRALANPSQTDQACCVP